MRTPRCYFAHRPKHHILNERELWRESVNFFGRQQMKLLITTLFSIARSNQKAPAIDLRITIGSGYITRLRATTRVYRRTASGAIVAVGPFSVHARQQTKRSIYLDKFHRFSGIHNQTPVIAPGQ
jgi:hypothetical protein